MYSNGRLEEIPAAEEDDALGVEIRIIESTKHPALHLHDYPIRRSIQLVAERLRFENRVQNQFELVTNDTEKVWTFKATTCWTRCQSLSVDMLRTSPKLQSDYRCRCDLICSTPLVQNLKIVFNPHLWWRAIQTELTKWPPCLCLTPLEKTRTPPHSIHAFVKLRRHRGLHIVWKKEFSESTPS